jgi:hypothetical protein
MARRGEWFRRNRRGGIVVLFGSAEATMLLHVIDQLRSALTDSPDSAVMQRLFPRAYLDPTEDRRESEFSAFVVPDLMRTRLDRLDVMTTALADVVAGNGDVVLDDATAAGWMATINDVRLALGVAVDITEDLDLDDLEPSDARFASMQFYTLLSWMLDELVDAMTLGLPDVPDDDEG